MKPRAGAATLRAFCLLSLLAGAAIPGCLLQVEPAEGEALGEAAAPLDDCTHAFVFSAPPTACNDAQGAGAKVRAGTDKVALESCAVVEINTYSASCEASLCSGITSWPAGHADELHHAAAEAECKRLCEAPGRDCVSLGVAVRSLQSFGPTKVSQCWDGLGASTSCGDDPEENPADWVKESPCATLVGASCATAFQRHNVFDCLCEPPGGGVDPVGTPIGAPGAGASSPGCHCQVGATPAGGAPTLLLALMVVAGARRRRAARRG